MPWAIVGSAVIGAYSSSQSNKSARNSANSQREMAQEQLDWNKQVYKDGAADRQAATNRANMVSDAQVNMMNTQTALANEYADYQRKTFRPLEEGMVKDAQEYDTPERREAAAVAAKADVETNLAAQRGISTRNLSRMGVNPSSGKSLDLNNQMALAGASMQAGASNKARTQVETMGHARKMDAASLGRGLAGNQATAAGLAITAGNGAAQNAQFGVTNSQSGIGNMNQAYNGMQSTMGSLASQQQKQDNDDAAMWASVGSSAMKYGMGKGYF